jgi:Tol biopolymer transport system component
MYIGGRALPRAGLHLNTDFPISPAWSPDSKTLVYASDCERALWFTALH